MTNPVTYNLKDLRNEKILGSFYQQESARAEQTIFRIEKVIKRDNEKKMALLKWLEYSDENNSWVPFGDLIKILIYNIMEKNESTRSLLCHLNKYVAAYRKSYRLGEESTFRFK